MFVVIKSGKASDTGPIGSYIGGVPVTIYTSAEITSAEVQSVKIVSGNILIKLLDGNDFLVDEQAYVDYTDDFVTVWGNFGCIVFRRDLAGDDFLKLFSY